MLVIMLIFTTALFFGSVGTPLVRHLAIKAGVIDVPKTDRAHTEPTALLGGLAIYTAAIIALLTISYLALRYTDNIFALSELATILISASLMAAVGLWDDRFPLGPKIKLAAQFVPVVIVFFAGVQIRLPWFGGGLGNDMLNFILTACWILYITNAINYLDNADGIAIMTSATTSAIFLLIAVLNGQQLVSMLAAAILGASLSFARYNLPLPKSTIFMGDAGALFLGYLLAILGLKIRIPMNSSQVTWMVPIIVLGLPIFDTFFVFISRWRRGVSFFQGGTDHTNHRLARLGLPPLSVALTVSLISGALGLVAIFITQASIMEAYLIVGALVLVAAYAVWCLEFNISYTFKTGKALPEEKNGRDD